MTTFLNWVLILVMVSTTLGTIVNAFKLLIQVRLFKVVGVLASLGLVGVFAVGALINSFVNEVALSRTGAGWLTTVLLAAIWFWSLDVD